MSARAFLDQSDFIAIVDVGYVHEVTTPEGFRLQSAKGKIVRELFRRHPGLSQDEANTCILYSLDVSAAIAPDNLSGSGFSFPIRSGKALVCVKMKGPNKFYPYEPLCFQVIDDEGKVMWPTVSKLSVGMDPYSRVPVETVAEQILQLRKEVGQEQSR
jgi:hypothetical protein